MKAKIRYEDCIAIQSYVGIALSITVALERQTYDITYDTACHEDRRSCHNIVIFITLNVLAC